MGGPRQLVTDAVLFTNAQFLTSGGGGVQWCTRDYLETIACAGLGPEVVSFRTDRSFPTRLRRRLSQRPFVRAARSADLKACVKAIDRSGTALIFLNNADALSLAPSLKRRCPRATIVYLSHGPEIVDVVNGISHQRREQRPGRSTVVHLGHALAHDIHVRASVDAAVCISSEDVLFERWLGIEQALFLPRSIRPDPLDWQPRGDRIGVVATLNHAPNFDGIEQLARAIQRRKASIDFRIVGGPMERGIELTERFRCITYCGALSEAELRAEASTWLCFVNPIFCQARGASTKVATALGWGLPVFTTHQGARGYRWSASESPLADKPNDLLDHLLALRNSSVTALRQSARRLVRQAPTIEESGRQLQSWIASFL